MKHNVFRPGSAVLATTPDGTQQHGTVIRNAEVDGRSGYMVETAAPVAADATFFPVTHVDRHPFGGAR